MSGIKSIDWTYSKGLDSFSRMEESPASDPQTEASADECECPELCHCDHENE